MAAEPGQSFEGKYSAKNCAECERFRGYKGDGTGWYLGDDDALHNHLRAHAASHAASRAASVYARAAQVTVTAEEEWACAQMGITRDEIIKFKLSEQAKENL